MTQALFFRGHDTTPEQAIAHALSQVAPLITLYPSLIVQLESVDHCGPNWDADIRVLAIRTADGEGGAYRKRHAHDPALVLEPNDPENIRSGNPNEWRPVGMKHDGPLAAFRFSNAAMAGELPQIPLVDISVSNYELARASEPELRKILEDIHQAHEMIAKRQEEKLELENDG